MTNTALDLNKDDLHFIPLGGSEQFGVNLNVYAYKGQYLAVDCGIGFADHRLPGVDIILPDAEFLIERRDNLAGLIVTHAHEDHVGAVPHIWPRLKCPIYCTRFTAEVLRRKFREYPDCKKAKIIEISPGNPEMIGPFQTHFIHVAHSIPESCSLVIETDSERVLHSGDWNLDPRPVINEPTDEDVFKAFGEKGITAYIGDSTNADYPGRAGSESEVEGGLEALFAECKGRIAITMFSSNIGRLQSVARAAKATNRHVFIVGRSLNNMAGAAKNCGYLKDIPSFMDLKDLDKFSKDQIVLVLTGSQGEYRAALPRIARGESRDITLGQGDTVIYSARAIPGNETDINEVCNNLVSGGVKVVQQFDTDHKIHISGHPYQDELADMYQWTKPKTVIPVHGERTQLHAQARFARKCQIDNIVIPNNGSVIRIGSDATEIIDHIETGTLAVEQKRVIKPDHEGLRKRRKLQYTGAVHVTLILNSQGGIAENPVLTSVGLIDPEIHEEVRFEQDLAMRAAEITENINRHNRDDETVAEEVRIGLRRVVNDVLGMKPETTVHIVRL